MKRIIFSLGIVWVIYSFGWSVQNPKRITEFSIAASFQLLQSGGETESFLNIPIRAGYFFKRNIEIEAEFTLTAPENADAGYILSGIASYNFITPGGLMPFISAGYGVTNSYPVVSNQVVTNAGGVTLGVLNLGGGLKVPMGTKAALRAEYRFQNFTGKRDVTGPFQQNEISFRAHSIFTGVSLFLP